eukprot:gene17300-5372_t
MVAHQMQMDVLNESMSRIMHADAEPSREAPRHSHASHYSFHSAHEGSEARASHASSHSESARFSHTSHCSNDHYNDATIPFNNRPQHTEDEEEQIDYLDREMSESQAAALLTPAQMGICRDPRISACSAASFQKQYWENRKLFCYLVVIEWPYITLGEGCGSLCWQYDDSKDGDETQFFDNNAGERSMDMDRTEIFNNPEASFRQPAPTQQSGDQLAAASGLLDSESESDSDSSSEEAVSEMPSRAVSTATSRAR